jgi:hypothetical protein
MNTQNQLFAITHPKLGKPIKMPLGTLLVQPERFQIRCGESNNMVDREFQSQAAMEAIVAMKEVVQAGALLDPLLVWKDTISGAFIVVDGHHRMEAYKEADAKPALQVWTQQLNVDTEGEVRKFSYDLNSRVRLHMPLAERQEATWKAIVTGEAVGSLRAIAHSYGISKSQVKLMKDKSAVVLSKLRIEAGVSEVPFDSSYIRAKVGLWKSYAEWRESNLSSSDISALQQKRIDRIVRGLTIKFGKQMKARPEDMLEAFAQFHEQVTRRVVTIVVHGAGGAQEGEESDF